MFCDQNWNIASEIEQTLMVKISAAKIVIHRACFKFFLLCTVYGSLIKFNKYEFDFVRYMKILFWKSEKKLAQQKTASDSQIHTSQFTPCAYAHTRERVCVRQSILFLSTGHIQYRILLMRLNNLYINLYILALMLTCWLILFLRCCRFFFSRCCSLTPLSCHFFNSQLSLCVCLERAK